MRTFRGFKTELDTGKYVGTPYAANGCYRLLRDVYLSELGIDLGEDNLFVVENGWGSALSAAKAEWVEVDAPRVFDAVLIFPRKGAVMPTHIGIFVGDGKVMHMRQRTGCVIEPLAVLQRAGVVEGFYRHGRLA